jgi:uncharacterized protein
MPTLPNYPGVFISENSFGAIPAGISTHIEAYMFGYTSKAGVAKNSPIIIQSLEDFEATVGNLTDCKSWSSARLFFAQRTGTVLNFINVLAAGAYPTASEIVTAINTSLDNRLLQGYLFAPEFFKQLALVADRTSVANALQALASDPKYYWVAIVDCGNPAATATTATNAVSLATADFATVISPKGHTAAYFPYWTDTDGVTVPMSASVVGVAIARSLQQGYRQPPAGTEFPVYGVTGLTFPVTDGIQSQLNPLGINCGRTLPYEGGNVIYGARTLSTDGNYKFLPTRVILNVLAGSLRKPFKGILFNSVDGFGLLFARAKATAVSICERMRRAGALYGATPEEAYQVICDDSNNPKAALDAGEFYVDVYVKPSPIVEKLGVKIIRVALETDIVDLNTVGGLL